MFSERVQSRAQRRTATRARVLQSAEQLFRELGFDATTIRGIATAAQVSAGTVMAVGDKDSLLVAVYDEWISAVHRERESAIIGNAEPLTATAAPEAILALFTPFVEHFARDPGLSRVYAAIIVSGRVRSEIFYELRQTLLAELQGTLVRAGLTHARAERGALVIYFGYLGLLMSAGAGAGNASVGTSEYEQFISIVEFVTNPFVPEELS